MAKKKLTEFLLGICKERGLSLRSLSLNAGLSPATVYNIINREYEPTLYTLKRLADYIGVRREYLWHLAGLIEDMDYGSETTFGDHRLRVHFARADKLPEPARNLIIGTIAAIITYHETGG